MPYVIRPRWLPPTAVAACTALLAFGASAAQAEQAPEAVDTSSCSAPQLAQPFLSANDSNYYVLAPGQTGGGFTGEGWTLSGGASIQTVTLPDGSTQSVLNMPSRAQAVSPPICVTTAYPTARVRVRNVVGGDAVGFSVGYAGTKSWTHPRGGGDIHGHDSAWTLSNPVHMNPEKVAGWQLVQITLFAKGDHSDLQLYDLDIDPYSR
jgi:hypothetical protein